jgi:hypothetical protein
MRGGEDTLYFTAAVWLRVLPARPFRRRTEATSSTTSALGKAETR